MGFAIPQSGFFTPFRRLASPSCPFHFFTFILFHLLQDLRSTIGNSLKCDLGHTNSVTWFLAEFSLTDYRYE